MKKKEVEKMLTIKSNNGTFTLTFADIVNMRVVVKVRNETIFNEYLRFDEFEKINKLSNIINMYKNESISNFYNRRKDNTIFIDY
jgi:hypothetical protein